MLRKVNGKEDLSGASIAIKDATADALFYDGLQYSPPARGSWNIVHSAMLVPESHQFYICALGCLRGVVLTAAEMGDMSRFSSIIIEEHHLYDGTMEETIIDSIRDILQGLPQLPKVAFIYPSCVHHFMGCDFDGIYRTLQDDFPTVQFMPCWMDPIRRQSNLTAEMRTRQQMYRPLKQTTVDRKSINIVGSNLAVKNCELRSLMEANGFTLHQLPECRTYADYEAMAHSFLNIGQEPLAHVPLDDLAERLGQQQLYLPVTWNYAEILANLQKAADCLEVSLPDYHEVIEKCETAFNKARQVLGKMPIVIDYTAVFQPFGLAKTLVEQGFTVSRVYTDTCTPDDKPNFTWLQEHCPSLMLYATRHAKLREATRQTAEPVLAIGQKAAYFTGTQYFVNIAEGGSLRDFTGILQLLDLLLDAYENPKDAVHYIQQKGWGCTSCL